MKKLRIGIIGTRGIPNHYGGFEQFAEHLSSGLLQPGSLFMTGIALAMHAKGILTFCFTWDTQVTLYGIGAGPKK